MARNSHEEKVRLLRSLAFRIHRKEPAADALRECYEAEGRGGRHRQWRLAGQVLEEDGFVASLRAGELIGAEAAEVLLVLERARDHRLLSDAIEALARFWEEQDA